MKADIMILTDRYEQELTSFYSLVKDCFVPDAYTSTLYWESIEKLSRHDRTYIFVLNLQFSVSITLQGSVSMYALKTTA